MKTWTVKVTVVPPGGFSIGKSLACRFAHTIPNFEIHLVSQCQPGTHVQHD